MKLNTILGSLNADRSGEDVSRRGALLKSGKLAGVLAAASMPLAFGLMTRRVQAQSSGLTQDIIDVLNFALTLEYLEDEFYRMGLESGVISSSDLPIFETISAHEAAHVALLQGVLGASAVAKPTFDFTAGSTFNPFGDYEQFKALSQGFEDTGVRAYKGQAANLIANDDVLTTALQIHSVEARHASAVRRLRGQKGWITGNVTDVPQLQAVYNGEEAANGTATSAAAAEAFDEPLTKQAVLDIAGLFIVS
jgi:ferritin-like protein